ncbi:glycosyltransferase family 2 protein [Providencia rettgeri]
MNIFISIISHGHQSIIDKLQCLEKLTNPIFIVIKSNKPGDNFESLDKKDNFHWINKDYNRGFGENNNIVYNYCRKKLKMNEADYFIVLNPDILVSQETIIDLVSFMSKNKDKIATINLFKNHEFTRPDNSIRKFPTFNNFLKSLIGLKNNSIIDKSTIINPTLIDWAAGSFLAFTSSHYRDLNGFNESYFMYCEDIDICYRSYLSGFKIIYYPTLKCLHLAQHTNRNILTKHFIWHVFSAIKFLFYKNFIYKKNGHMN